jgi:hypothetical protein
MNTKEISSFLNNMFSSNIEFANIHGMSKVSDVKTMLVADVLSENVDALATIIKERFEENSVYRLDNSSRVSTFA